MNPGTWVLFIYIYITITLYSVYCIEELRTDNGALRRIFGFKREDVTGDLRKMLNKKLHKLCPSPHSSVVRVVKSRMLRLRRYSSCMGEVRRACRILVRKHEGTILKINAPKSDFRGRMSLMYCSPLELKPANFTEMSEVTRFSTYRILCLIFSSKKVKLSP
jgi:hypothetical protein